MTEWPSTYRGIILKPAPLGPGLVTNMQDFLRVNVHGDVRNLGRAFLSQAVNCGSPFGSAQA